MTYQQQANALSTQYGLGEDGISIKPIGNGHINTTLLLQSGNKGIVVQKLNTQVFPDVQGLVNNARKIEAHLTEKRNNAQYNLEIIKHVESKDNQYLVDLDNECWRALEFIGGSFSEDVVENAEQATIAANAFGQFAAALNDFDAHQLVTVIPEFHNLAMRVSQLQDKILADNVARLASCQTEVDFCIAQQSLLDELARVCPDLPLRACHNDTKINNMLFCTTTKKAKAVIDLDTCMSGYWMFDFGDMVRTFCSPEAEDSTNLANVEVREEIFQAIVEGYVAPLKDVLTDAELESFWLGAKVMCFMIGVRFLTDYLDGDNYFSIKYPEHNLDRARNQFALYQSLLAKESVLKPALLK
ncbi:phosphotransferase enzyme family protein [Psychrobium sp. 1_MG-2023]|uniref:phosphotransferase enzyme family protein n=1 Tax=Psychrobium sp. 1_MG-2023 TaxID=3062624 RepID=UPI000C3323B1|nr:aminoglycoside phosphotransferase family protein [Psychrobium sp. 1_MG-2023]MDP2560615.1 aminoglycoside phosphotransferase family protein [Psychrobium sp. 1_MG-2023]PKF57600.1 aminoglycoside phosphotransferase [Alteromonadales bacterium alter-6D02]